MSEKTTDKFEFKFKNIFENAKKAFEELQQLKSIANDENTSNFNDEQQLELVSLVNSLKQRLDFLSKRRSVRVCKRRMLTRQKRHEKFKTNQTGDDDLINFKINEFFQTEQLFGQFKKFDQKIEDQIKEDKVVFNSTLATVNSSLFDLKQLKDFSSCLLKLVNLRSRQRKENNSAKNSVRLINELFREINEKKVRNEKLKSRIKESLNIKRNVVEADRKMPNRKVFYSTLNKTENLIRANLFGKRTRRNQIESEKSIGNLIAIRQQWDRYISKGNDRNQSIPLHWIEPNQTPNEEWAKYIKN